MNRRRWIKRGAVILGLVVAFNVAVAALGALANRPSGPASSSYATAPAGFAAWADLLARDGRRVERVRERPDEARLDSRTTAVMVAPDELTSAETGALRRFVERGGRLVAGGPTPQAWLHALMPGSPAWWPRGDRRPRSLVPVPETGGVRVLEAGGNGAWIAAGAALPVIGSSRRSAVAVARVGRGRLVLLADSSPLENRNLARADNAALALSLAGEPGRPVAFVESVHGFGEATGVDAIPVGWRVALVGLALAGLVLMVARGRRLGPPERSRRALAPPRSAFVRALARNVERAKAPTEGLAPLQAAARGRLVRRAGLGRDPGADALGAAGARFGLEPAEVASLGGELRSDDQVMAVGRALARLEEAS